MAAGPMRRALGQSRRLQSVFLAQRRDGQVDRTVSSQPPGKSPRRPVPRRSICRARNSRPQHPMGLEGPRNTFTLPLWLRIFPDAKVVSIERNGVDVAQSLRAREINILNDAPRLYRQNRLAFFLRLRRSGFVHSPRCLVLEDGFALWEEYTSQARAAMGQVPAERVLALRYEDVLDDPVNWLGRSADFCGLKASQNQIENAVKNIRTDRAKAYESDVRACEFCGGALGSPGCPWIRDARRFGIASS